MSRGKGKKLKLLVVDDETDNLDLLYRTFRREFQVYKAESALKALEVLDEQGEMGIIISDQRMPEMNGTEFLSKTVDRFPETIRILLTGYTDVEDLVEAINSGQVFKYITKPWNPEELKAVVSQASDTYQVLKQRTDELRRIVRRESLFNDVMNAIRGSLDYRNMMQTLVETVGNSFEAENARLYPVESGKPNLADILVFPPVAEGEEAPAAPTDEGDRVKAALAEGQTQSMETEGEDGSKLTHLVVPIGYQKEYQAVLAVVHSDSSTPLSPEDIQLLESVAEQAALALSQARLYQRTQELVQKMLAELEVARQIQTNLLRQSWPDFETEKVQACCYPAREVGGDFFEVYVHPQGDLWLALGDVSGKGVPAALFMASAMSVMRRELSQDNPPPPERVMQNLNSILSDDLIGNNCFITMVVARYTPSTRELVYANAGHIYPLVWPHKRLSEGGDNIEPNFLKTRGVPVGILPMWKAKAGTIELQPGDVLLLTSDGITEATVTSVGADGQKTQMMLQQEGLWELLKDEPSPLDLSRLLDRVRGDSQEQEDDQTILSLEVL